MINKKHQKPRMRDDPDHANKQIRADQKESIVPVETSENRTKAAKQAAAIHHFKAVQRREQPPAAHHRAKATKETPKKRAQPRPPTATGDAS